jgi:hypothetical protein
MHITSLRKLETVKLMMKDKHTISQTVTSTTPRFIKVQNCTDYNAIGDSPCKQSA